MFAVMVDGSVERDNDKAIRGSSQTKMFLLTILRLFLGRWSGTAAVVTRTRAITRVAKGYLGLHRAGWHEGLPHDCVSVDYVLMERPCGFAYRGRGTFPKANQPLRCALGFLRRSFAAGQMCPALVPTTSLNDPRLRRG